MNTNICTICDSKKFQYFSKQYKKKSIKKYVVEDEHLYQCEECGTITVLPKKKFNFEKDGDRYYGQMRLSSNQRDGLLHHIKYSQVPKYDFFRKEILDKKFNQYKKWLDIGSCGYATTFINYDFITIEPDKQMVSLGKELFDDEKIFCSDLISFKTEQKFDAVLFNHSFYCIANPSSTIEKIDKLLVKDGLILVGIGHIFMDAVFTKDAKISSIEDILLGETQKIYYCKESLQYLFNSFSYEIVDDFFMKHDVPVKNSTTRYLVFKKTENVKPNNNMKILAKKKIEDTLEIYKKQFYEETKINFDKLNNKNNIFIGDKKLLYSVCNNFDLTDIHGFIDYKEEITNIEINKIKFLDYSVLSDNNINNIVILDLKNANEILEILENTIKTYKTIYYPTRQLSLNSLFYNIKLQKYISNTFEFESYQTIYAKMYKKILFKMKKDINKIAIFGTAKAGMIAFNICKRFNLEVECFIDDNKQGFYQDTMIPIVSKELFALKFAVSVGLILKGPSQKGLDVKQLCELDIIEVINI